MIASPRSRLFLASYLAPLALLAACSGGGGDSSSASGTGGGSGGANAGPTTSTGSPTSSTGGMGGAAPTTTTSTGEGTTTATSSSTGGGMKGCTGLPLCDDFEGATAGSAPDAAKWTVAFPNCKGTGTVAVDGSKGHSGSKSVKVSGKGGYCNHVFIGNSAAIGAVGKVVYARFFVQLETALGGGHTTFLAMKDTNDAGGKDLRMGGQSEILMYNRESDDATLPSLSPAGIAKSVKLPPNKWSCVEFMVDQGAGLLQTWVDGTAVEGLQVDAKPTPDVDQQWLNKSWKPSLTDFRLGWESYAGQDMNLWFDDVAIGPQRIGCQ